LSERCELEIRVPEEHPAFAGHFPGAPVAPAVLLLDLLLEALETRLGYALHAEALPHAKFMAPLKPGDSARAIIELDGRQVRFRLEAAGRQAASGVMVLGPS